MDDHEVVTDDEWIDARKNLLEREKELTKLRDEVSRQRRALPWRKIDKPYTFHGPQGDETLGDLFDGRSQLIVYHFMFGPDWSEGCKSCSYLADHYDPAVVHLAARDVTLVTVSRAPLERLEAFRRRMGWGFKWVSSHGSDFNWDFHVSFEEEEVAKGTAYYNYRNAGFPSTEGHGLSVFYKNARGDVFHTYSSFSRGLDMFMGTYHLLDVVPKGRDEEGLANTMAWVRHHDRYDHASA